MPARLAALSFLFIPSVAAAAEPLRLPTGEPLIGIYFFTRWWEPWRSHDEVIRSDLRRLREMGFNTLFIDHEPSQMFDGNWAGLDRDHRLAREAGLQILPWLEAKNGRDVAIGKRFDEVERRWGAKLKHAQKQDGTPAETLMWEPEFSDYMVAWISDYLDRYSRDGAILRVVRNGETYRVVSACVEIGWDLVSFDEGTNQRFRNWLGDRYETVEKLNAAWGTDFKDFGAVDPCDQTLFDYSDLQKPEQSPPVTDHTLFRAELCRDVFKGISARLKKKYPDLLLVAELPYEFGYMHPHALGYAWQYAALPVMAEWADILLLRSGGFPSPHSEELMLEFTERTGIPIILTHRTRPGQGPGHDPFSIETVQDYAKQAATFAHGLGYYSWNEMVDTHIARTHPATRRYQEKMSCTAEQEDWLSARVTRINQAYLDIVGIPRTTE